MKKLKQLNLNKGIPLNNTELQIIRGGYGWLTCRVDGVICWSADIDTCDHARVACDAVCGSWSEAVCAGF